MSCLWLATDRGLCAPGPPQGIFPKMKLGVAWERGAEVSDLFVTLSGLGPAYHMQGQADHHQN